MTTTEYQDFGFKYPFLLKGTRLLREMADSKDEARKIQDEFKIFSSRKQVRAQGMMIAC